MVSFLAPIIKSKFHFIISEKPLYAIIPKLAETSQRKRENAFQRRTIRLQTRMLIFVIERPTYPHLLVFFAVRKANRPVNRPMHKNKQQTIKNIEKARRENKKCPDETSVYLICQQNRALGSVKRCESKCATTLFSTPIHGILVAEESCMLFLSRYHRYTICCRYSFVSSTARGLLYSSPRVRVFFRDDHLIDKAAYNRARSV